MDKNTRQYLTKRDKAIICGLFLSQWDKAGLGRLALTTFTEAFNVLGYALGVKPASIKNYRDELDPLFPNPRKGWHKRALRPSAERIYEIYKSYDIEEMASLIAKLTGVDFGEPPTGEDQSSFVKRQLTGAAAENFFLQNYNAHDLFRTAEVRDMTRAGCGYDFSLRLPSGGDSLAVEVKGLAPKTGGITLTAKEYDVATVMTERYFLYVVAGMDTVPNAMTFRNPIFSGFSFQRAERSIVQVTWQTKV